VSQERSRTRAKRYHPGDARLAKCLKRWYYAHQRSLTDDGSLFYKNNKSKDVTQKLVEVIEKMVGDEIPLDRE